MKAKIQDISIAIIFHISLIICIVALAMMMMNSLNSMIVTFIAIMFTTILTAKAIIHLVIYIKKVLVE